MLSRTLARSGLTFSPGVFLYRTSTMSFGRCHYGDLASTSALYSRSDPSLPQWCFGSMQFTSLTPNSNV
ncbi:hypothetical protein F2P81_004876 [Scophthalmus maximus]|uniref:Uncharacterized protein n=1 Tax=Scophthalmus maximus TaxID=52904 RepID=A0A6A4TFE2_SCOMX|nr:hypothetical protein F2P81_004876 [Scophthalmus maximus]